MSFAVAANNPPQRKYKNKMDTLLETLPGDEAEALVRVLEDNERWTARAVRNLIAGEASNHKDIPETLFTMSDNTVTRWRDSANIVRNVTGL